MQENLIYDNDRMVDTQGKVRLFNKLRQFDNHVKKINPWTKKKKKFKVNYKAICKRKTLNLKEHTEDYIYGQVRFLKRNKHKPYLKNINKLDFLKLKHLYDKGNMKFKNSCRLGEDIFKQSHL